MTLKRKGTVKNSPEAQQQHSNSKLPQSRRKWLRCNRSAETVSKFKLQRAQELTRTQRKDGKQDARNGHAQVASRAQVLPEEHEPDAERTDVRQDEQEFRTAQQQGARSSTSTSLDKTCRTKQFSQHQTWRNAMSAESKGTSM